MSQLRVILVDDEPLLLESLDIILTLNDMEVIGTACDGSEALAALAEKECDLALVDLNMKGMGGIELIGRIKAEYPSVKILVLTTFYDDKSITQAIAGGADGYLLKDSGRKAILGAIGQLMNGVNVIDSKVMQKISALMECRRAEAQRGEPSVTRDAACETGQFPVRDTVCQTVPSSINTALSGTMPEDMTMTRREKEICTLLARGLTNRQIAEALYISEGTVKNYVSSIYDKTGIHNRARLIVAISGGD